MTLSLFSERLRLLRREIALAGLDGFIVPNTDEFQSEYLPPSAKRVAFLSGFTGSAATLVVLNDRAAFFTDGRYTLQAMRQVSDEDFCIFDTDDKTVLAWLEENAHKGARIAYDPWLHSMETVARLKMALARPGAEAVPVARNLVDIIWEDQPEPPVAPIYPREEAFSGKTSVEKRAEVGALLAKKNIRAAVLSDPASIAWLLNVRGGDIAHTPLPLSRAILRSDGQVEWFVDLRKVTDALPQHLGEDVAIFPLRDFPSALGLLAHAGVIILVDPVGTPSWIADFLVAEGGKIEQGADPCAVPRCIKNGTELVGMRLAHVRDGAVLTTFLAWLDAHWEKGQLTEVAVERKLEELRSGGIHYRGPSFETISAVGEHAAIIHYTATKETNAPLLAGQLYLVDTGGQYLDGTTDVTRTVVLGEPSPEMRENFTHVLKGHIALASARFPQGTTGADLDVLARQFLWFVGRDYAHGTGHGVGSYLGVHEGPVGISKRNQTSLKSGMVLTNEPGFYKAGHYGIRLENVMTVIELSGFSDTERKFFGFDTMTMAPFDRRLIKVSLLTDVELAWLNAYHRRVWKSLSPLVDETTRLWLERETKVIERRP